VDVIERIRRKGPWLRAIFNFATRRETTDERFVFASSSLAAHPQFQVRGDPGRLNGRDVGSDHLCLGEFVGEIAERRVRKHTDVGGLGNGYQAYIAQMPSQGRRVLDHISRPDLTKMSKLLRPSHIPVPVPMSTAF